MNNTKKELLLSYIRNNVAPVLIDFIDGNSIPDSIVLHAKIEVSELNGHYEGMEYKAPKWMSQIYKTTKPTILVIDKIDSISKEEQTKFIEILKYKQISTFELPKNTIIVVTAEYINKNTINEEIYSLVAHIKG